jgi:hypothetical protein
MSTRRDQFKDESGEVELFDHVIGEGIGSPAAPMSFLEWMAVAPLVAMVAG